MSTLAQSPALPGSSPAPRRSREGVPLGDYRWGWALLALPLALLYSGVLRLWGLTTRLDSPGIGGVPRGAIVYLFHGDLYADFMAIPFFAALSRAGGAVLGNHTFLSYFWSGEMFLRGWRCFRYVRREGEHPVQQIIRFLKEERPETFRLATDSGGPYGRVRSSLVEMALATGRPLVGVRVVPSRAITLRHHAIPLPFCRVQVRVAEPVRAEELAALTREQARALLQSRIDALA